MRRPCGRRSESETFNFLRFVSLFFNLNGFNVLLCRSVCVFCVCGPVMTETCPAWTLSPTDVWDGLQQTPRDPRWKEDDGWMEHGG